MVVLVMVPQMVLLQPPQNAAVHRKMMSSVMDRVVTDIAEPKSGECSRCRPPEREHEKEIENHRQRNADHRRHHQAGGIVRVIVMHSMHDEMQQLAPTSLRLVMKN